ncbi:MAG TPA: histidine kinase dimerization/phospho-acceptor domain-containing protein [Gaiellaceae bacterium]|nr:histidine kinase dimerization/phospho-acceptor domain-containing protein [Gaiellaceae bacterium]
MAPEPDFARFVSLACHDLRTPLATVSGFAHTLDRLESLGSPADRYVGMILAATDQLGELLDELGLVARIESGRYEPALLDADTRELASAAAALVGEQADADGSGATVRVDREPTERALAGLARCALRHGALERVHLHANGGEVLIEPINADAAAVVLAEELRDLGAATAHRLVGALGGSVTLERETLHVRLPTGDT